MDNEIYNEMSLIVIAPPAAPTAPNKPCHRHETPTKAEEWLRGSGTTTQTDSTPTFSVTRTPSAFLLSE